MDEDESEGESAGVLGWKSYMMGGMSGVLGRGKEVWVGFQWVVDGIIGRPSDYESEICVVWCCLDRCVGWTNPFTLRREYESER